MLNVNYDQTTSGTLVIGNSTFGFALPLSRPWRFGLE
jgi:hypothetical protein